MTTAALIDLVSSRGGYWGEAPGSGDVDVLVIRNGDVKPEAGVRWSQLPTRAMSAKQAAQSQVKRGDLLITTSGDCGVTAFVEDDPEVITCSSNFVRVLRPNTELVDPRYLFHYSRTGAFRAALRPHIRGTTMQNLSTTDAFAAVTVPLPDLTEQRRLAAILDKADYVRDRRRQVLDQLDALAQAMFLDLFGSSSSTAVVQDVASPRSGSVRTGPFGSQLLHSEFVDAGIAVLGLDNVVSNRFRWEQRRYITPQKYEELKRYTVAPGDVLISIMGTCGRCVVVPEGIPLAINTKHICAITVDRARVLPEYVRACFLWHPDSRRHLEQRAKGSIMAGLNMGIIKEMPLPVPPLGPQGDFVARLQRAQDVHGAATRSKEQAEALLVALQQRAYAGAL